MNFDYRDKTTNFEPFFMRDKSVLNQKKKISRTPNIYIS